MTHIREVAKMMVVFIHGMACFTDKLTTTILESMGYIMLALITIPFALVNKVGLFANHIFHLILDTGLMFLAFVVFPILKKIYGVFSTVIGLFYTNSDSEEKLSGKWDQTVNSQ